MEDITNHLKGAIILTFVITDCAKKKKQRKKKNCTAHSSEAAGLSGHKGQRVKMIFAGG